MKRIDVEVLEDVAHPEGGFAVIVLHGVASISDGITFRLKPVEARGSANIAAGEWPRGEQRPRAIRQTASTIELLIGPEIVESSALLPGTLGVIEIQSAGLRGEFLWPSIRPTARPRRRNLSVVKSSTPSISSTRAVSRQADQAAHNDGLASLNSSRVLREASSGTIANDSDIAAHSDIAITALDHSAPATASIVEAISTNIVHLNVARDAPAHVTASEDRAVAFEASAANATPEADRLFSDRQTAEQRRQYSLTAAVVCMIVGGAGYFMLRERPSSIATTSPTAQAPAHSPHRITANALPSEPAALPPAPSPDQRTEQAAASAPLPASKPVDAQDATATRSEPQSAQVEEPIAQPAATTPPLQEVTLRMRGGGFQISGELKGFDGMKYVIETRSAGTLTMDATRFECLGEACARPAAAILPLSERPSPAKPDAFRIEGAMTLAAEFIPQLIRDYAASIAATTVELPRDASHPGTRFRIADARGAELSTIEIMPGTSTTALTSVERGTAAIALVDRPQIGEQESRAASAQRTPSRPRQAQASTAQPAPMPSEIVLGLDGIAAVTAPQNYAASLSIENLAKVLAGQITDWFELGQSPGPISVYLPPEGTGSLETFVRQIMRPRSLEISRTAHRLPSEPDAADAAAKDPRGIALVSIASQRSARAINLETQCGLIVKPTAFSVKTGEYPLVRRLSLQLAPQLSQPSARGLVRIAQSNEVQNALSAARIVDSSIASLPIEEQAERMAWAANAPTSSFDPAELRQMLTDLDAATRLSTTFRFIAGTNELDARSKREIQRLAAAMKEPELTGRRIILAGFTDAGGKFQVNLAASLRRAGQVRAALLGAAGPSLDQRLVSAKGYGPLSPVGCNGTPEGTRLNRRVEVWVAGAKDLMLPR